MSEPDGVVALAAEGPDLVAARHGAKAVGLQRLLRLGLPVPPALVVPIGGAPSGEALANAAQAAELGERLAVRSGAPVSAPGALETVLDVAPADLRRSVDRVVASVDADLAHVVAGAHGTTGPLTTAVIVQRMVDAAADRNSGAGAATSRDPVTGEREPVGSLLWQTSGVAVMSGTANPLPLEALEERLPAVHAQLIADLARLDQELGSAVEVEFAVEQGTLWYLQLRTFAGEATTHEALPAGSAIVATGTAASAGIGRGRLQVDLDDALDAADRGEPVVLVRTTTSPADVPAMIRSAAIVTSIGSRESHAAVVARSVGIPAVVGIETLEVATDHIRIGGQRIEVREELAVDGTTGAVARPASGTTATVGP